MSWWSVLSRLANESERDIRRRVRTALDLMAGGKYSAPHLDDLTGRVHLITTLSEGHGEKDFKLILSRERHCVAGKYRVNWPKHGSSALLIAIRECAPLLKSGDILAIVRGGGDTREAQFDAFRSEEACAALHNLVTEHGVVLVTGIGHAADHFAVDAVATFAQATPTDAAYKICELLRLPG